MTTYSVKLVSKNVDGTQLSTASTNPNVSSWVTKDYLPPAESSWWSENVNDKISYDTMVTFENVSDALTNDISTRCYIPSDTNHTTDVYMVDLSNNGDAGNTDIRAISVNEDYVTGNAASYGGNFSAGGYYGTFTTTSTNMKSTGIVKANFNPDYNDMRVDPYNGIFLGGFTPITNGYSNVYYTRSDPGHASNPWLASSDKNGTPGNNDSWGGQVDYLYSMGTSFTSKATNLVEGYTQAHQEIYNKNIQGTINIVSVNYEYEEANGDCNGAVTSGCGNITGFESNATNLAFDRVNTYGKVQLYYNCSFRNDRSDSMLTTSLITRNAKGEAGNDDSGIALDDRIHTAFAMDEGAGLAAFQSKATNFTTKNTNGVMQIYVKSLLFNDSGFATNPDLTTNRTKGSQIQEQLKDPFLVSTSATGEAANAACYFPSICNSILTMSEALDNPPDWYVVFESRATNLVPNLNTHGYNNVYLKDLQSGAIVCLSVGANGEAANGDSSNGKISENGRTIVFQTDATNLFAGDANGVTDVVTTSNPFRTDDGNVTRSWVADWTPGQPMPDVFGGVWAPKNNGALRAPIITGNKVATNGATSVSLDKLINIDTVNTGWVIDYVTFVSKTDCINLNGVENQMGKYPHTAGHEGHDLTNFIWFIKPEDVKKVTLDTTGQSIATLTDKVGVGVQYGVGWQDGYYTGWHNIKTNSLGLDLDKIKISPTVSIKTLPNFANKEQLLANYVSATDPNPNSSITQYKLTTPAHGTIKLNGATNLSNTAGTITVSAADFAKLTYLSSSAGLDTLNISAADGDAWSAPSTISINSTILNTAPNGVVTPNFALATNKSVQLQMLYYAVDPDAGDSVKQYKVVDPSGFGSVQLNGATNLTDEANTILVSADDYSKLTYVADASKGAGTEAIKVSASDGVLWSDVSIMTARNNPLIAPAITTTAATVAHNASISLSPLVRAASLNGDQITEYKIVSDGANGTINLNGAANLADDGSITINAEQLSLITYTSTYVGAMPIRLRHTPTTCGMYPVARI